MDASSLRALPIAVAVAGFVFLDCVAAPAATGGPFARIPALPTTCYSQGDSFLSRLEAAKQTLAEERDRQQAINARIEAEYQKLDPMEMSQRMTQWMMDNPQAAAQSMQTGQNLQAQVPELVEEEKQFKDGYKELADRYEAAMEQALAPARAARAALDKRLSEAGVSFGCGGCDLPDYAVPELQATLRMADAAYQAACPRWWGANGEIPTYVKRHREWLVTRYLPAFGQIDDARVQQFAIMNTPAASYKPTFPHQRAEFYIDDVRQVYGMRPGKPYCTSAGCEGFSPAMHYLDTGQP